MTSEVFLAYLVACAAIAILPGPSVTLIVATSMRHGARAGLGAVVGSQFGIALMILVVGVGLASAVEQMGYWFEWVRLAGAAYLVFMGVQMFRSSATFDPAAPALRPGGNHLLQGFLVSISNPKTMVFFGAFFPQFLDPGGNYALQIAIMGVTVMATILCTDSAFALLAGRAGRYLSSRRARLISRLSGSFLVGGGLWLALSRAR